MNKIPNWAEIVQFALDLHHQNAVHINRRRIRILLVWHLWVSKETFADQIRTKFPNVNVEVVNSKNIQVTAK